MTLFLAVVGWTLYAVAILVGLVLDLLGLFGNWIILGATALAWALTGMQHFTLTALVVMLVLAVLGEVVEAAAAGFGAVRFGGNRRTMLAAVVGCLLGAVAGTPWFPVVGTLAGACLGAFAGAALHEYIVMERAPGGAMWTGLGAALGKVLGLFAKTFVGLLMLAVAALTF